MNPTLLEIMTENYYIRASRIKNNQIRVCVYEDSKVSDYRPCDVLCAHVNQNYWDELVYFAKQILTENDKLSSRE